jgi:hypothetical protein
MHTAKASTYYVEALFKGCLLTLTRPCTAATCYLDSKTFVLLGVSTQPMELKWVWSAGNGRC